MAGGYQSTDHQLFTLLSNWLAYLRDLPDWYCDLFANDRVPALGDTITDYAPPTWAGYASKPLSLPLWGKPAVANHVASTSYTRNLQWLLPDPVSPAPVYGYYVYDRANRLLWSEKWAFPLVPISDGTIFVAPVYSVANPVPVVGVRPARSRTRG